MLNTAETYITAPYTFTIWKGGWAGSPSKVESFPAASFNEALKFAYIYMRVHPDMQAANIYEGQGLRRWWARDGDGVWQPQEWPKIRASR